MTKFKNKTVLNAICIDRGITVSHIENITNMKCLSASTGSTSCLKTFKMLKEMVIRGIIDKNNMLRLVENYILNTNFDEVIDKVQERNKEKSRRINLKKK